MHFIVKEENLQLVLFSFRIHSYFCIMADLDPNSGSKLFQGDKIVRKVRVVCD